jgi:hypothetical protein
MAFRLLHLMACPISRLPDPFALILSRLGLSVPIQVTSLA